MLRRSTRRPLRGRAGFAAFAGLVACTEILGISGDPSPNSPVDAHADTPPSLDSAKNDAAPRCNPDAAFGTPEPVPGLDLEGKDEYGARFSDDERTVYFYYPEKDNRVQTARLENGRFTAPLPALNTLPDSEHFALSQDGSWAVLAARGDETPLRDLYRAVPSSGVTWTVTDRWHLSGDQYNPYIGAKGEVLFQQDGDIQISLPSPTFSSRTYQSISNAINTASDIESDPVLSRDEKSLYFSRDNGLGTIVVATRSSADSSDWVVRPGKLFDKQLFPSQRPTWISPDGCHLYFSGTRRFTPDLDGSSDTDNDIYVARKPLF